MCFIVDQKQPDFKIAENDIECYKVCCECDTNRINPFTFRPFHREYFAYSLNVATVLVDIQVDCAWQIREGYHSYKSIDCLVHKMGDYTAFIRGTFVIPKGAKYYENRIEYVSETLIFKGYIK